MSKYGLLLAACVLVLIMPVCLPSSRLYATHVDTCWASADTSLTGHVDWYQGRLKIWDYYVRTVPLIKRGYTEQNGRAQPRMNGFCTFTVPYHGPTDIPTCTLHYYQSAHNGSADLRVNWLYDIPSWNPSDNDLFWAIWNDTLIVATDAAQGTDGWHTVALTGAGCAKVGGIAGQYPYGGALLTGWSYRDSVSGTYADVTGSGQNAPFLVAVYQGN